MAIFRRQTDEVFSTLQQVQRRLSQNTEMGEHRLPSSTPKSPSSVPTVRPVARHPQPLPPEPVEPMELPDAPAEPSSPPEQTPTARRARSKTFRVQTDIGTIPSHVRRSDSSPGLARPALPLSPPVDEAGAEPEPEPEPEAAASVGDGSKRGLRLGPETMGTIAVFWILTLVLAFMAGGQFGAETSEAVGVDDEEVTATQTDTAGQSQSQQRQPQEAPAGVQALGPYVLVLASHRSRNDRIEAEYRALADKYNVAMSDPNYADQGLKPWFGVRYPSDGGIQFVFGEVNGVFGIDRETPLAKRMFDSLRSKRFTTAFWYRVGPKGE